MQPRPDSGGDRLGQRDPEVRAAFRFAVKTTAAALAFIVLAALWVRNCGATGVETVGCGAPYRTLLALGAPTILTLGGLWAFVCTYQVWRDRGTWWGWQGAGWFLFSLMVFVMIAAGPPIIGMTGR